MTKYFDGANTEANVAKTFASPETPAAFDAPAVSSSSAGASSAIATPALQLDGVCFAYGEGTFMESLTLEAPSGCVTAVLGPNGSGKSTMLKLAAGLLKPKGGQVLVAGKDLRRASAARRAKTVAYLPQRTAVAHMTVEDLVLNGRFSYGRGFHVASEEDRAVAEEAMALTGVADLRDRDLGHLSGGQRQRAYIAMMLAQRPEVLLLDEPISALDVGACHEVLALVQELCATRAMSVIIVLHDLDLALRYADRVLVLQSGEVVWTGEPHDDTLVPIIRDVFGVRMQKVVAEVSSDGSEEGACEDTAEAPAVAYSFFPVK